MNKLNFQQTIEEIREFVTQDDLYAATKLLRLLLSSSEKLDEAIIQSAKLKEVKKEIRSGTISFDGANLKIDRIRNAVLEIIREIETVVKEDKEIEEEIKHISVENEFDIVATFSEWRKSKLGKQTTIVTTWLVTLFLINIIAEVLTQNGVFFNYSYFKPVSHLLQFLFIGYVILTAWKYKRFKFDPVKLIETSEGEKVIRDSIRLYRPNEEPLNSEEDRQERWMLFKEGANKASRQFSVFWLLLWLVWLCLYITFGIKETFEANEIIWVSVIENLFNNANTLMIVFLFLTVTISTSRIPIITWIRWSLLVIIFSLIEIVLINIFENHRYEIEFGLRYLTGGIASIVLMAFLGRLGSKFLNIPLGVFLIFYFYVLVQFMYPFFNYTEVQLINSDHSSWNMTLKVEYLHFGLSFFALIVKAILFLVITWLLQTGKILFFVIQESSLNFKRDDEFERMLRHVPIEDTHL